VAGRASDAVVGLAVIAVPAGCANGAVVGLAVIAVAGRASGALVVLAFLAVADWRAGDAVVGLYFGLAGWMDDGVTPLSPNEARKLLSNPSLCSGVDNAPPTAVIVNSGGAWGRCSGGCGRGGRGAPPAAAVGTDRQEDPWENACGTARKIIPCERSVRVVRARVIGPLVVCTSEVCVRACVARVVGTVHRQNRLERMQTDWLHGGNKSEICSWPHRCSHRQLEVALAVVAGEVKKVIGKFVVETRVYHLVARCNTVCDAMS
jgi:hypothetical protein